MIARRERVENALGTIGMLLVCAIFVEIVALAVAGKISSQAGRNVAALALGITICVVLPACCGVTKFNRRHDNMIVMEIKRRLEVPLRELFELEHAGQRFTIAQFTEWRDQYIDMLEEGYVALPVNMWIRVAREGELPTAYKYRQSHPGHAIIVDAAMSLALAVD